MLLMARSQIAAFRYKISDMNGASTISLSEVNEGKMEISIGIQINVYVFQICNKFMY